MNTEELIELNDLALTDGQQTEVKGGPVNDFKKVYQLTEAGTR